MATIYRALATAMLLIYGWAVVKGLSAGDDTAALATHVGTGLFAAVAGCLVNSVPFAYFLGTRFWVKAFVRASRAGDEWSARHDLWMKDRAYPVMYLVAFFPAGVAITGGLVDSGRIGGWWHFAFVLGAVGFQAAALLLTPRSMLRNSALMDELADTHHVPRPGTQEMDALIEHEEQDALPPLFQLSRVLLLAAANVMVLWLYLRFGTESWRGAPLLPFALGTCALAALGLGLNARFDPDHPASRAAAWSRALAVGVSGTLLSVWLSSLGV